MASLIPGYEYDIFISYRQKDNKGDRWVSEFVEALKTELESTFKEEISIYFDINPHDGLLETHDVDASLKDKLKCLVFIPVLSRTYCDPKSFAWKNEFEAFVEQAAHDQLGLNIKLQDGNVISRILPVCIHDLDPEDIRLVESNIGPFRAVDFIYYSQGVNRPLRQRDDDLDQNIKQLIYRDQINKTALAVKEIILGLKGEPFIRGKQVFETKEPKKVIPGILKSSKTAKQKLLAGASILATLIIAAIIAFPGFFRLKSLDKYVAKDGKIPIAVMPFQNMTNDTSLDILQDGIQNMLITNFSHADKELQVRQFETISSFMDGKGIENYASLAPDISKLISKKLKVNIHIQGSIKQSGDIIRVNTQLFDTRKGEAFKSFQLDGTADNIFSVVDSLSGIIQNFLIVSVLKKGLEYSDYDLPSSTLSAEAFKYNIYGEKAWIKGDFNTAIDMYMKAVEADSNEYHSIAGIAESYLDLGMYEQAKEWCRKLYSKLDVMDVGYRMWATDYYKRYFEKDDYDPFYIIRKGIETEPMEPSNYYKLGYRYYERKEYDKAIPAYEKALKIYKKDWGIRPSQGIGFYILLGTSYVKTGQFKKAKKLYKIADNDFPDNSRLPSYKAILYLASGDTIAGNEYIEKYFSANKDKSWSEAQVAFLRGVIYVSAGMFDRAEGYYRKALLLDPENPDRMNALADFLVEADRHLEESQELVDKALQFNPDNIAYWDTKGWGLYKLGKYKEALEIYQKLWDYLPDYTYFANARLEAAKKAVAEQNKNEVEKR
jgi:tetratricopeptide (TPR) repeat protein